MVALENWLAEAPPLMQHGLSAALAVIGVALWLLGRSLARPLGAVTGLVASAGAALLFARERFGPLAIILGAAVGCAVAWLLFRHWMGALTATLGAALVAGGFVFWAGDAAEWMMRDATAADDGKYVHTSCAA